MKVSPKPPAIILLAVAALQKVQYPETMTGSDALSAVLFIATAIWLFFWKAGQ